MQLCIMHCLTTDALKSFKCETRNFEKKRFVILETKKNTARHHPHPHPLFFFYESKKLLQINPNSPPFVSNQFSSLIQSSNCPRWITNAPIYNSNFHVNLIDLSLLFNVRRFRNLGSKKASIFGLWVLFVIIIGIGIRIRIRGLKEKKWVTRKRGISR